MHTFFRFSVFFLTLSLVVVNVTTSQPVFAQRKAGGLNLRGLVLDESGAGLAGAEITLTTSAGKNLQSVSGEKGGFAFDGLAPGEYLVKVSAPGFAPYQSEVIQLGEGQLAPLMIQMAIETVAEQVTVDANQPLSLSADNNASAVVFKGADLETLPEDPDELASALQELAGPGGGPGGAQLFVDGFSGIRLPPKSSIREIRINSNPFSAEYDRLGFGRIEILTKPGIEQLRGEAFFNFNDESLNARNAFAPFRGPLQVRRYGGNLSGSIIPKKASFFVDFERRDTDENASVNATILDANLQPVSFSDVIVTPRRFTTFSPRVDWQVNDKTTLVVRYNFNNNSSQNQGIGNFSLETRGFDTTNRTHTLNFTATTIFSPQVINEVRLQMTRQSTRSLGDNSLPSINVSGSFNGGGAQVGENERSEQRFEFQDYVTIALNAHSIKTGVRLRGIRSSDSNTANFGGAYTFAGDVNRDPVTGQPIGGTITSLEQYRRVLLGLPGYRPSQFTLNAGDPFVSVNQYDAGAFFQDEWRVRDNLTLSMGLRYEAQTNLSAKYNFAPRVAFAYAPRQGTNSSGKTLGTVIRGGFGIFYDRFDESLTLGTRRLDGNHVTQFFTTQPDFFPNIPDPSFLNAQQPIRRQIAQGLEAPYIMQAGIGIEQQLPFNLTTSVNYVWSRGLHQLRSRNVNAPLPGTFTGIPGSGTRPFGNIGDIYLYEATGRSETHQIRVGVNRRLANNFSIFSNYTWTNAKSDTEDAGAFPVSSYDLSTEWGRTGFVAPHQLFMGGSTTLPWGVRLNSFINLRSGRPFNITLGRDLNGDTVFTERPSFAQPGTPGSITTDFGTFSLTPKPGEALIPRNYGDGPGFASVNVNLSKTFNLGAKSKNETAGGQTGETRIPGGFGGMGGGGRGGGFGGGGPRGGGPGGGFGGDGGGDTRYSLTFSIRVSNLLNRTNLNNFSGSLTSPIFGLANSASESRRIEAQVRFRF